jgi:hypothetical protein
MSMLGSQCSACCSPSTGTCVSFKSVGWAGQIVDVNTRATLAYGDSHLINGTGYGNAYRPTAGGGGIALSSFDLPLQVRVAQGTLLTLAIDVTESVVRVTLTVGINPYAGSIVLESDQVEQLVSGEVIHVSQVVSNTVPNTLDEYDNPMVSVVGSFYLKRDFVSGCACSCNQNFYDQSQPLTTPDAYTLQFTNTNDAPSGPRWASPYRTAFARTPIYDPSGRAGKYTAFLPLGDFIFRYQSGVYSFESEVTGCHAYIPRFTSPIVLRKVAGTSHSYISDPIQIRPCVKVRYSFDACFTTPNEQSPRLTCTTTPSGAHFTELGNQSSSSIWTPAPMCVWEAEAYQADPSAYADYLNEYVYHFGNFATVSPGGNYAPETQLLCGRPSADNISLMSGCRGVKCPPTEIQLVIVNSRPDFAADGTYALPLTYAVCTPQTASGTATTNILSAGNTFYQGTFTVGPWTFTFQVTLSSSVLTYDGTSMTTPDCDKATVLFSCGAVGAAFGGYASTNAFQVARRDQDDGSDAGRYRPMCQESPQIESYWKDMNMQVNIGSSPSQFWKLGDLSVTF